jgi:hypothetical protein
MLDVWEFAEGNPWDLLVEAPGLGTLAWENRWDLFGLVVSERRNNGPNWRNGAWSKLIRMRETDRIPLAVLRWLGLYCSVTQKCVSDASAVWVLVPIPTVSPDD